MIVTVSHGLLLGLALVIIALCVYGVITPKGLIGLVMGVWDKSYAMFLAVVVRIALGVLILVAAETSRFPTVFFIIGWISIVAAIAIAIVGKERIGKVIGWGMQLPQLLMRMWCLFGVAFGLFLGYGVI